MERRCFHPPQTEPSWCWRSTTKQTGNQQIKGKKKQALQVESNPKSPTLKRLLLAWVDGCRRRSSDWGSWTFSIPAPRSSFFSRAEYARPSAGGADKREIKLGCRHDSIRITGQLWTFLRRSMGMNYKFHLGFISWFHTDRETKKQKKKSKQPDKRWKWKKQLFFWCSTMGKTSHSNNAADDAMENALWSTSLEEKPTHTFPPFLTFVVVCRAIFGFPVLIVWLFNFL